MTTKKLKVLTIVLFSALLTAASLNYTPARAMEYAVDDAGAVYKAKCAMCHSATASKNFDAAKTDDELVQIILKGKKGEKPPYMPGYEEKGITAEMAKELVAHMRQLKAGTN